MRWLIFVFLLLAGFAASAFPQGAPRAGKSYPDGHGGKVFFPMGDISFADEVVAFKVGDPAPDKASADAEKALGAPDYDEDAETGYVTLGCGGSLVLRFTDNALVDVEGPDLYVFEIGPAVEPTKLAVSPDGRRWVEIGEISGGRAEVDIAKFAGAGEVFHFVRLTDLKTTCGAEWPGADIDAVGAIGSAMQISLRGAVLFDVDRADLKPEAIELLRKLAGEIGGHAGGRLVVEGHTDSSGTNEHNQTLSEDRAGAVGALLRAQEALGKFTIATRGYGETRPATTNDTAEGRARNRRVSIIVIPSRPVTAGRFDGTWRTSQGPLVLRPDSGGQVAGKYNADDNGRLILTPGGSKLTGYWVENGSSQRCETEKDGSYHWGRVMLEFNAARTSFQGWWSYCGSYARSEAWTGGKSEGR